MAPRLRPLLTPPNDGTQKENRLDLRVALKMGAGHAAEASHRHTRRREKIMGRFKSPRQAQRCLSVYHQTAAIYRLRRHCLSAKFLPPGHSGRVRPTGGLHDLTVRLTGR
jgi:hypothetical protein